MSELHAVGEFLTDVGNLWHSGVAKPGKPVADQEIW